MKQTRIGRVAGVSAALVAATALQYGLLSPTHGSAAGTIAGYVSTPTPMVANGGSGTHAVSVKAVDAGNAAVPNTQVFLTLTRDGSSLAAGAGTVSCATTAGGTPIGQALTATPTPTCFTAADGTVSVSYTAAISASGIEDLLTVSDQVTMNHLPGYDWFKYSPLTGYTFKVAGNASAFVAPAGTAGSAATCIELDLQAVTSATVYLSLASTAAVGSGGSAAATSSASDCAGASMPTTGAVPLTSTPAAVTVTGGVHYVWYKPGTAATGLDTITAQDQSSTSSDPSVSAIKQSIAYSYGAPASRSSFDLLPIATAGSLSAAKSVTLTVKASDGSVTPFGSVDLALSSLAATTGTAFTPTGAALGSATATCTNQDGTTASVSLPHTACVASSGGTIPITFTPAAPSTTTGTDVLSAAEAATTLATTAYSYGTVAGYAFSDANNHGVYRKGDPAPPGTTAFTLGGSDTNLYVTAVDSAANPVVVSAISLAATFATTVSTTAGTLCVQAAACTSVTGTRTPFATSGDATGYQLNLHYDQGTTTGGQDIVTASKSDGALASTATQQHGQIGSIVFQNTGTTPSATNIAPTGSLTAGQIVNFTVQGLNGATPDTSEPLYLSIATTSAGNSGKATCNGVAVGTTPTKCTYDGTGHIPLTYQAPNAPLPGAGADTITAQDALTGQTASLTKADEYDFTPTLSYTWSPSDAIAPAGSLTASQSAPAVTLTANGGSGPVADTAVYVSLFGQSAGGPIAPAGSATPANGSSTGPAPGQCQSSIGQSAVLCTTDAHGQLQITYAAPGSLPAGGQDVLQAQPTLASPAFVATLPYDFTTLDHYSFSPGPIASAGSLASHGATPAIPVNVTAVDGGGHAVAGATVYLKFVTAGTGPTAATAQVSAVSGAPGPGQCSTAGGSPLLTSTFVQCKADASGVVSIQYSLPASQPSSGKDTITAASAGSGAAVAATDSYNYAAPASYSFSSTPIAPSGSIGSGGTKAVAVTVLDSASHAVSDATVYLELSAPGGGSATVPATQCAGTATNGRVSLSATAVACSSDSNGQVAITYVTASSPPDTTGGTPVADTLTAASSSGASPTIQATDTYTYNVPTTMTLTPTPAAASGTLIAGNSVLITLSMKDAYNHAVPNAQPSLTFSAASATTAGTATVPGAQCSGTSLSASATTCTTDSGGSVVITYTPGNATTGTDTITASNVAPSLSATDTYTYTHVAAYSLSPTPIAGAGTMASAATQVVTVTSQDSGNSVVPYGTVYLSLTGPNGGTGIGSATVPAGVCGVTTLTTTPTACVTDNAGHIGVTYTAATPPTAGGVDTLAAQNAAASPAVTTTTTYTYLTVAGYVFSTGASLAPQGSLGASGSRPFTISVRDVSNNPVPNSPVTLTLGGGHSGPPHGSAFVTNPDTSTTPIPSSGSVTVNADSSGNVSVTYTTPATLPANGFDSLCASNAGNNPTVVGCAVYAFPTVTAFSFSPNPIAPSGSLGPNGAAPVVLTATANTGTAANTRVYVVFNQASGGGSVSSGQCSPASLGAGAVACVTDGAGHLSLTYTAPSTLPSSGTDQLIAQDAASSPSVTATDSYVVQGVGYYMVASDGGIFPFGSAMQHSYGSTGGQHLNQPIVGMALTPDDNGYYLVASDGGIFPFGDAADHSYGSTGNIHLNQPIVGMAVRPDFNGYYLVASDGGIFPFGPSAVSHSYGSTGGTHLNQPIVGMAMTHSGNGYWLVASDGGIFPFGDAVDHSYGSTGNIHLNQPIVGMAPTASGNGYYLVASDGGLFPFGDALGHSYGSTGGMHLNKPIVGMALTPDGNGYYLVASDGGIFPFGPSASGHSYGSTGNMQLNAPIVGMAVSADGNGYYLVASDGGIFPFGPTATSHSYGSTGGMHLNQPIVGMALATDGNGYYLVASDGGLFPFGSAQNASYGSEGGQHLNKPIVGMTAI
jgi:hypothetical protein